MKDEYDQTRKILKGVLLISHATQQDAEQVLDRVLDVPRKGPTPAGPSNLMVITARQGAA